MIYLLPTSLTESWYDETVVLDGSEFRIRLSWSERERRWYFSLWTADGTPLLMGKKVVAETFLTSRLTDPLRPSGEIVCIDRANSDVDPDLRDLGTRCVLLYIEWAELNA